MSLSAEDLELIDARLERRLAELRLQREDFRQLAESQARLTEGQIKLEAAMARLAENQDRLTEGQAGLEAAVVRLTENQDRLTEGQARLEAAVVRLIENQDRLTEGQDSLRREVGALAQNVGFGLEELAGTFLPAWLEKHEGLRVSELTRAFVPQESPTAEEVDLMGVARRDGETLTVVVECKARVHGGDVGSFIAKLARITPHLAHPPYPVMVAYVIHPTAQRASDQVRFVSSHQL